MIFIFSVTARGVQTAVISSPQGLPRVFFGFAVLVVKLENMRLCILKVELSNYEVQWSLLHYLFNALYIPEQGNWMQQIMFNHIELEKFVICVCGCCVCSRC